MPARTPLAKIPYPTASDRIADYPTIAKELAEKIERLYASQQRGRVGIGAYGPGQTGEATMTFARAFKKPPNVAISCSNQRIRLAIYEVTTTGFKYYVWNDTGGINSVDAYFDYIASCDDITD